MNVSNATTTIQALLRQIDPATPPVPAKVKGQQVAQAEASRPQVTPAGQSQFDPNSPRGTYLNIVV